MSNWYEQQKRSHDASSDKTSTSMLRLMRFTTLRGLFMPFFDKVINILIEDSPILENADVEHYRGSDVGFLLKSDEDDFELEVRFIVRQGFMNLEIDGSHDGLDFSGTHRLFQEDTIRKIAREISIRIPV